MSEKPTPTDEELDGQPAPETQPDADLPDLTPQARADDEQERRGSTAPGQEPDQQRDQEAGQAPGRQADQEPGQQDGREPGRS